MNRSSSLAALPPCALPLCALPSRALAAAALSAAALAAAPNALAAPLVAYTDADANTNNLLATSRNVVYATQWSQTVATRATLSTIIVGGSSVSVPWWVTTRIGPGTTAADVVHSGTVNPAISQIGGDFDPVDRIVLGTDLDFAAGTYYLVLGWSLGNGFLVDGSDGAANAALAPGFSLGNLFVAVQAGTPAFGPDVTYSEWVGSRLMFELTGTTVAVPAPSPLALLAAAAIAAALVRPQARAARRAAC